MAGENKEFTFFWKTQSPFSQWHTAPFTVDGTDFTCAEQFMMHQKAVLFNDEETAMEILQAKDPKTQKSLGRRVKNFDEKIWNENRREIVKKGNLNKFSQNAHLKEKLLATRDTVLVEASPVDRIWGIGLAEDDPRAKDKSQWRGANLLGSILTEVRDELR